MPTPFTRGRKECITGDVTDACDVKRSVCVNIKYICCCELGVCSGSRLRCCFVLTTTTPGFMYYKHAGIRRNAAQRQTAVTAYFASKQLPLFVFAGQDLIWIDGCRDQWVLFCQILIWFTHHRLLAIRIPRSVSAQTINLPILFSQN